MKKIIFSVSVLFVLALVFSSCSGASIKKDAMSEIKRVGLLSVTIEKVEPQSVNNIAVMQAVANYSAKAVEYYMKTVTSFTLVPYYSYANVPDYKYASTFANSPGTQAYLKNKAETDPDFVMKASLANTTDIAQAFGNAFRGVSNAGDKGKAITNATTMAQEYLDGGKKTMLAAAYMPFLPYNIFNDKDPNTTTIRIGNTANEDSGNNNLKQMLFSNVETLCTKLNLDAMLVVYVFTQVPEMSNVRIISKDRVLGDLKLDMTLLIINRHGEIVADLGRPAMDDLAPNKRFMPVHLITSMAGKMVKTSVIELKDSEGKVFKNFCQLSLEASSKMITELRKTLGEIK
ncbi:MAG: hypothetical protein WCJ46_07535 [bacterium]